MMPTKRSSLFLSLLGAASAQAAYNSSIQWGPCPTNGTLGPIYARATVPIECGKFDVPLDYTQTNSTTLTLNLLRIPAPKQPAEGTIQFNFGGPGSDAARLLIRSAEVYQALSGGVNDLITFEPRGVGEEIKFVCTQSQVAISKILANTVDLSVSDYESRRGWAAGKAAAGTCQYQGNGNFTAEHVGTVAMAKDMARIADVVDKDGKIRFWGISYGTTLGATIAAMFPERVDRMILDGVQNAHEYYRGWVDSELWTLTDKVIDYMFESCVEAGPELCAPAALNKTGSELVKELRSFIDDLTENPLGVDTAGDVFDGGNIKGMLFGASYDTMGWPNLTASLVPFLHGSTEEKRAAASALLGAQIPIDEEGNALPVSLGLSEPLMAIHCGDRTPRTDSYDEIEPSLKKLYDTSYYQGGMNGLIQTTCAQWPWKAKEQFTGSFEVKTKHPILIMTNLMDGQTPPVSAHNASASLEGSVVLSNNGAGHSAFSAPSKCTGKYMFEYFTKGTLPPNNTVCEPTDGPYETQLWEETLKTMPEFANKTEQARR